MDKYHRPTGSHRTDIEILRSRFITTINRATSPEEARTFIQRIRNEMPDASHHVYAFRAGYGATVTEGMSDDGEPSGTSGPPTLAVLRGSELGDIVLVTTRYFGGTKLGTGGLVRAYTEAAQTCLASLETELKTPKTRLGLDSPYHLYEQIKNIIIEHKGHIDDETFAGEVSIICTLAQDDIQLFTEAIIELSAGSVEPFVLEHLDH